MTATAVSRRLQWIIVATIVLADQLTKALVRQTLELHESMPVIPDVLALTRVHNSGAAFGMFNSMDFRGKTLLLIVVASVALLGVAWYAVSIPLSERLARLGVACILGGAIGNLIDRATAGYVLDFVDASWRGWHFWAFNVADAAISIGVILMILDLVGLGRRASDSL
ncbi:MAG TPA: signal peptidase II [Vicinamibacterales bacterium]|nr:signal peptidase II [Vicinamibacterales bacterium]